MIGRASKSLEDLKATTVQNMKDVELREVLTEKGHILLRGLPAKTSPAAKIQV